jgi:amidase
MKPTHGLVPYTGIMPIEATLDHAGPITANVRDNALMLEAIAGGDGLDPRQYAPTVEAYTAALDKGVRNLKIGILTEGFQLPNMDTQVAEKVRGAVARLQEQGLSSARFPCRSTIWLAPSGPHRLRRAHRPDDARQRHGF